MAKGFGGGGGAGGGMNSMIKQAQKMQRDMEAAQLEVEALSAEASAGGGAVTVVATGKKQLSKITIKPEAVDPDDVEMLEDLVMAAANEALRMIEEMSSEKLSRVTKGMSIPGMF